jgi:CRISPR/Cas system CSM-associated protein Csm3 (group 7 of RAMP superfamily)
MLTAIEGIYDNGQIILKEKPILTHKVKVFVMFTEEDISVEATSSEFIPASKLKGALRGAWKNVNSQDQEDIKNHFDNIRNEWERDI